MNQLTAPGRLGLLLPWLNGSYDEDFFEGQNPEPVAVRTDWDAIRSTVAKFIASFDGSDGSGYLTASVDAEAAVPTDEELDMLGVALQFILEQGFGDPFMDELSFPTAVRITVRGSGRTKPGWKKNEQRDRTRIGGVQALRNYQSPGAYILHVTGPTVGVVTFCFAQLLTAPGVVAVRRCERQGCDHFLATAAARRGRPQKFCSEACRFRNHADRLQQQSVKKRRKKP